MALLNDKINEIRKSKKMTIDQLSNMSGFPKSTITKICAGITTNPNLETVKSIAKALSCKIDDFDDVINDTNANADNNNLTSINSTNIVLHDKIDKLDTNDQRIIEGTVDLMLKSAKYEMAADDKHLA